MREKERVRTVTDWRRLKNMKTKGSVGSRVESVNRERSSEKT